MPTISIILCTHNRSRDLRETLHSLAQVERPQYMEVETLIVDNASTDDTRSVVEAAMQEISGLRYIYQNLPSKCQGLNKALGEAKGDYLVFTDDDLRFPTNWLTATYSPLWEGKADAVLGGITIASHLKKNWMTPYFEILMASTECYENQEPVELVGANMGFARYVLEKVPQFDTELGPGALGVGEESLFSKQLQQAGFRVAGSFDVKVEHHFDPSRLQRSSMIRRFAIQGQATAYRAHHWEHETVGFRHYRHFAGFIFHLAKWRLLHPKEWMYQKTISLQEMSLIEGYWFFKQLLLESRRKRNYEYRGLVKQAHPSL